MSKKRNERCFMALNESQKQYLVDIHSAVEKRLSSRRFFHVKGVVDTAQKFAKRYGVDEFSAIAAAYLHDWDKEHSNEELIELVKEYKLGDFSESELKEYYPLLHAWTGAFSALKEFPELPTSVFVAISKHTTAAKDMSNLDKIIYCADMLEPSRGVKSLDKIAAKSKKLTLDELYFTCFKHSMKYLLKHDKQIYPPSIDIWNELIRERNADCKQKR